MTYHCNANSLLPTRKHLHQQRQGYTRVYLYSGGPGGYCNAMRVQLGSNPGEQSARRAPSCEPSCSIRMNAVWILACPCLPSAPLHTSINSRNIVSVVQPPTKDQVRCCSRFPTCGYDVIPSGTEPADYSHHRRPAQRRFGRSRHHCQHTCRDGCSASTCSL